VHRWAGIVGEVRLMSGLSQSRIGALLAEPPRSVPTADFYMTLVSHGLGALRRDRVTTLQVNVGKLCNMACHHCHVEAGPLRTEIMTAEVAARVLELVADHPGIALVDFTGGAPELNPSFRWLVTEVRRLGRRVIDRCNLTVLDEPGQEDTARFLAESGVEIVASLPCYTADNVTRQRGKGAFDKSIEALTQLNALGYGRPGSGLLLDLVYNPVGASLPPAQAGLERRYREELLTHFGLVFTRLLTITNLPIARFAHMLARTGQEAAYMSLLVNHFNPATVDGLMCRSLVSVGWDGRLYDCDFNQMLEIPLGHIDPLEDPALAGDSSAVPHPTVWNVGGLAALTGRRIATAPHCFGCTAGAGSSCGGAIAGTP